MAVKKNNTDPFAAFGIKKATRGRVAGVDDAKTVANKAVIVKAAAKPKKSGDLFGVVLMPEMFAGKVAGTPIGQDTLRKYATEFCKANAGWSVAGKISGGGVLITKPVK